MHFRQYIKRLLSYILNIPEEEVSAIKARILIILRQMLNRPLIYYREELPFLLNFFHLNGDGAEIGVWKGEFSEYVIKNSNLSMLFSIDAWREFDKRDYDDKDNVSQNEFEEIHKFVVEKLRKYKERSKIIRKTSREASYFFNDGILDFIYIDANHSYEACKEDLEIWWPKLRENGIFAGHDYLEGKLSTGTYGVKKAVDEFVAKYKQRLYVTHEKDWPVWYFIKNTQRLSNKK